MARRSIFSKAMRTQWGSSTCAEGVIVYHRIGIVVAEVTRAINRKADQRLAQANRVLAAFSEAAKAAAELMDECSERDPATMSGPRAANAYRILRGINAKALEENVRFFASEFGAMFDADTKRVLADFSEWLPGYTARLRDRVATFESGIKSDLKRDSDRLAGLAAAWSAVDGDGLT